MNVLARSKSGPARQRRQRDTRSPRESVAPEPQQPDEAAGGQRRRREPAPQDVALYSCQCGYVFEAPVSTSVGCPHCGDAQAW